MLLRVFAQPLLRRKALPLTLFLPLVALLGHGLSVTAARPLNANAPTPAALFHCCRRC